MIVAALAAGRAALPLLTSRLGIAAMILAGGYVFYEGVPIGPFSRIPFGVGTFLEDVTGGRVRNQVARAREGFVSEVRLIAAEAKSAELLRQLEAGRIALASYAELLAESQAKDAVDDEQFARDRLEYEKKLQDAGKSRTLDQSDIEWLRK